MSYEGFEQVLCCNGHYFTFDAYNSVDLGLWHCPICGEHFAWENSVNQTNGSHCSLWDGDKHFCREAMEMMHETYENASCCGEEQKNRCLKNKGRIDGYVDLKVKKPGVSKKCPCCGAVSSSPIIYEIPTKEK